MELTQVQREAIGRARFKTANIAHTWAIVYDADADLMATTGLDFTPYGRGSTIDHEGRTYDPDVIEYVVSLTRAA